MPSQRLPAALSALSGVPVQSISLEALEQQVKSGADVLVATHTSNRGAFCAYLVPPERNTVLRASTDYPVRARLRRLCRVHPAAKFLATGEVVA
jgi:hypothetical protein